MEREGQRARGEGEDFLPFEDFRPFGGRRGRVPSQVLENGRRRINGGCFLAGLMRDKYPTAFREAQRALQANLQLPPQGFLEFTLAQEPQPDLSGTEAGHPPREGKQETAQLEEME